MHTTITTSINKKELLTIDKDMKDITKMVNTFESGIAYEMRSTYRDTITGEIQNQLLLCPKLSGNKYLLIRDIFGTIYGKAFVYARAKWIDELGKYIPDPDYELTVIKRHDKTLVKNKITRHGNKVHEDPIEEVRLLKDIIKPHSNLIRVCGYLEGSQHLYTMFPYIDGGELFEYVSQETAGIPEKQARKLFRDIVLAVKHVHDHGVIHCDISPENVLIEKKPELKCVLIDFGLAHIADEDGNISPKGVRIGKYRYMAPEMYLAQNKKLAGKPLDVWSLGATLFVMLYGVPFTEVPCPELSPNYKAIAEKKKLAYALNAWNFNQGSLDAIDLMQRIFEPNPLLRITMDEILKHPFLNEELEEFEND